MVAAIFVVGFSAQYASAASHNIVVNGSFEDPVITSGTWDIFPSILGWTSSNGIEVRNNQTGTASDGSNFVELDSTSNSNMIQTLSTVTGKAYSLSFDYSPRIDQSTYTNPIEVYWNGVLLDYITAGGVGNLDNVWTTHTYPVTATGSSTNLEFKAVGTSDSLGGNLDNVIVELIPETDSLDQIFDILTDIFNAITGVQDTVDRIETTVNNVAPNTERVSVTVNLDDIYLENGEVMVLLDTTGSGTLSTVHVAANLPCNEEGVPLFNVVAGVAGGDLSGVITNATDNTGFNGPYETCVFHDTVSADTLGHDITDVIIINPGIASDEDNDHGDDRHDDKGKGHDRHDDKENGKGHDKYDEYDSYESKYLEGVVITITGTYN